MKVILVIADFAEATMGEGKKYGGSGEKPTDNR